jgi:hypothetical protein
VVWARFFKELMEVVRMRSHLALAVACGLCGALCTRATCLLIDAAIVIDCGLLTTLFARFLAGLGILLGTLDCGAGWCLPTTVWHRSKWCHIGMVGGDGTPFLSSALGGTDRCVEGS